MEKMVNYSLDMICTIDRNGCFVYVNNACKSILGYESEEMTGQSCILFVHPEDRNRTTQVIEDIARGNKTFYFENRYLHKEGGGSSFYLVFSLV